VGINTATLEFRGDLQDLVTILRYMRAIGRSPRTRSELVKSAIEMFSQILVEVGKATRPATTTEAMIEFQGYFESVPARKDSTIRALVREMGKEALKSEGGVLDRIENQSTDPDLYPSEQSIEDRAAELERALSGIHLEERNEDD